MHEKGALFSHCREFRYFLILTRLLITISLWENHHLRESMKWTSTLFKKNFFLNKTFKYVSQELEAAANVFRK